MLFGKSVLHGFRFDLPRVALVVKQKENHRRFELPRVAVIVKQLESYHRFKLPSVAGVEKVSARHPHRHS